MDFDEALQSLTLQLTTANQRESARIRARIREIKKMQQEHDHR